MRELFQEVLDLQLQHSSQNTPEMQTRGDLIRNTIPAEMREWKASQTDAAFPFRGRLNVQGRDGTGLKTFVPWVRIHSPELSPSAQNGWYVVYLFSQDGSTVSLCISHGSTRFDGGDFKPRSSTEAAKLMQWGRGHLLAEATALNFDVGVALGSQEKLSKAYERTTAFSKTYHSNSLPTDDELEHDAERAVALLGQLYRAVELGQSPESEAPEIVEAEIVLETIARPLPKAKARKGQSFGLSQEERKIVELRAMEVAQEWLSNNGYTDIMDVSAKQSCDFWASKDGFQKFVEVKGTTASLGSILLTANEVELHRTFYPDNVLIVVHKIELVEARRKAIGGQTFAVEAWKIEQDRLRALSYRYELTN